MFERIAEKFHGTLTLFNTTNNENNLDNRSDDKGIEPESVVMGNVRGRLYAFIGLERDSGIVVFDLSTPTSPTFVDLRHKPQVPNRAPTKTSIVSPRTMKTTTRLSTSAAISAPRG